MLYFRYEMDMLKKYTIAHKGLSVGKHHFDFEVNDKFFSAFDGSDVTAGHADVSIDVETSSGGLSLQVKIHGEVITPCDRCLEDCTLEVDYDATLIIRFSESVKEYDGEVMWLSQGETEVNLAQYIYESIYLSLPYQKVHPMGEDGKLLCNHEMLEKFRIVTEEEFEQMVEPKDKKVEDNPQWAKLKEIKDKLIK